MVSVTATGDSVGLKVVTSTLYDGAFAALHENGSVSVWGHANAGGSKAPSKVSDPNARWDGVVNVISTTTAFAALHSDGSVTVWGNTCCGGASAPASVTNPALGYAPPSRPSSRAPSVLACALHSLARGDSQPFHGRAFPFLFYRLSVVTIASNDYAFVAIHETGSASVWGNEARGGGNAPASVTSPIPGCAF